jgi:hypothetical protein
MAYGVFAELANVIYLRYTKPGLYLQMSLSHEILALFNQFGAPMG